MKNNKGFTLIELMIAVFVGLVVAAGLYTMLSKQMRFYRVQQEIGDAQSNSKLLMKRMVKDIGMAGYDPLDAAVAYTPGVIADNAAFIHIRQADTNCFRYQSDLSENGLIGDVIGEDVKYCLDYNSIERTVIAGGTSTTTIITENIDNLVFTYFQLDAAGNIEKEDDPDEKTFDLRYIRGIRIDITVRTKNEDLNFVSECCNDGYRRIQLSTRIKLRNLGL